MIPHETVHVGLGARSYDVLVGEGLLAAVGEHVAPVLQLDRTIIVTDENVASRHLETLQRGLSEANIANDSIVLPPGEGTKSFAQLHALMVQHAQSSLSGPKSGLHLLRLSESTLNGLLGIMFDSGSLLPRQGSAVFEDEIQNFYPNDTSRKSIQTTVHELGHALNLAHRFEREVGRADSLSFMNYDSRYKGGAHESEFWSNFDTMNTVIRAYE